MDPRKYEYLNRYDVQELITQFNTLKTETVDSTTEQLVDTWLTGAHVNGGVDDRMSECTESIKILSLTPAGWVGESVGAAHALIDQLYQKALQEDAQRTPLLEDIYSNQNDVEDKLDVLSSMSAS